MMKLAYASAFLALASLAAPVSAADCWSAKQNWKNGSKSSCEVVERNNGQVHKKDKDGEGEGEGEASAK